MKRYRFRLEPVRAIARRQEEQALGALAAAHRGEESAVAALRSAEQRLADRPAPASPSVADFTAARTTADWRALTVRRAGADLAAARERVEQAREALATARTRRGALDRLDERGRAAHAAAAAVAEERMIDDLVSSRHGRPGPVEGAA